MSYVFEGIEPKEVLEHFYNLSQVTCRKADNTRGVSDYLTNFGKNLGLSVFQDETDNVIIYKPATPGYESAPTVILEGHMDMICTANPGVVHDFEKDPIEILLDDDGDTVRANGTTLGADDGLGVAMIMAVLSSSTIEHPNLEAVFTTNEETDMKGALQLHYDKLKGKIIFSLDGDRLALGGGGELEIEMFFKYDKAPVEANDKQLEITIDGLIGGHSGKNAYLERGNAITLLIRLLSNLQKEEKVPFRIVSFTGGDYTACALARDARCIITYPKGMDAIVKKTIDSFQEIYTKELAVPDPDVKVTYKEANATDALTKNSSDKYIDFMMLQPDGIRSIHKYFEHKYESCVNLGVVEMPNDKEFRIITCIRATAAEKKYFQYDKILRICDLFGVSHNILHDLPQWEYNANSRIAELARNAFDYCEPAIGQGTCEMGIFLDNIPGSQAVGIGPIVKSPHSPNECFSIKGMERDWHSFIKLLKDMKNY